MNVVYKNKSNDGNTSDVIFFKVIYNGCFVNYSSTLTKFVTDFYLFEATYASVAEERS